MIAGDQVPEMPLGEVVFKTGATFPVHKVNVDEKSGAVLGVKVTTVAKLLAHCPAFGVKV